MGGEGLQGRVIPIAIGACLGSVGLVVVFLKAEGCVAVGGIVRAVPVVLVFWRALLEDLTAALRT